MRKIIRVMGGVISISMAVMLSVALMLQINLPDRFYIASGQTFSLPGMPAIKTTGFSQELPAEVYSRTGNRYQMLLSLPGGAVIKTVSVQVIDRNMVIPGGSAFGIKMFTNGVMVVGLSDIDVNGKTVNPAKNAGIKSGDIIVSLNGQKVNYNEDVGTIVSESGGRDIEVVLLRGKIEKRVRLTPVQSPTDRSYKAGIWVRDSSAGIGTMTYYDPSSNMFVGLGHAICDVDTGSMMPLSSGEAVEVTITGVNKGSSGFPGELKGIFSGGANMGRLFKNTETGIYGKADKIISSAAPVPLATRSEVKTGPAVIYSTIDGKQPQEYSVVIERIFAADNSTTKNMIVRVIDQKLLNITGGIVQGMSGAPIIQDGKLIGAVTHVFVNDPTRGYAIFAENMQQEMDLYNPSDKVA